MSDVIFALGIVGVNRVPLGACYVFPREGDVVSNITVSGLANDSTDIAATLSGGSLAAVMTVLLLLLVHTQVIRFWRGGSGPAGCEAEGCRALLRGNRTP